MTPLTLLLTFCLLAHVHTSAGHETLMENELPPEVMGNDFDESQLENAANNLDDTFEDDVIDNEFERAESAAENRDPRSNPKWFRGLVRKVVRISKKIGKGFKKITKKVGKFFKKGFKLTKKFLKEVVKLRRKRVCYRPYGCFRRYRFIWDLLPQSPRKVKTKFFLTTREHPKGVRINPFKLGSLKFKNRKTIVITHGWKGHYAREKWIRMYAALFLKRGNFNVIEVYWGGGARTSFYPIAAGNTRLVGRQIAHLIQRLNFKFCLSYNNVHIIGHSLGAHVAGHAGKDLRRKNHRIARITGLDPAGPIFARRNRKVRLDSTDAKFVDVLHTSYLFLLGVKGRAGDADFYVNGGGAQPGCKGAKAGACSHARVINLFKKTILPSCRFKAHRCQKYGKAILDYIRFRRGYCRSCRKRYSCIYMGYDVNTRARGAYFLRTKSKEPYCNSS